MRILQALLLWLPLVAALPQSPPAPLGGRQITDPARIAQFEIQHADVLEKLQNGKVVPVEAANLRDIQYGTNEKRIFQIAGLAGVAIIEAIGAGVDILGTLGERLYVIFGGTSSAIWKSTSHCRTFFQTHSGGEELIKTYARGSSKATDEHKLNQGWINPESTAPPVLYFEDESSVGVYSVQFTATDGVAWSGTDGTEKCYIEGLCNPQYVFYRTGYNIVLNTWQSQGELARCQYSGGTDCRGLCSSGVLDQFTNNGVVWGGDCAIPCLGDEGDGYTTTPKQSAKVMIAGDSISHGMERDFTWRWRLFEWLDKGGYKPQFVGPFSGTFGPQTLTISQPDKILFPGEEAPAQPTSNGFYGEGVSSNFANTAGHASWWGRQAAQTKETINGWVAEHQPDYLLLLLGFNDLGWFVSGPDGLIGNIGELVQRAREAKPDLKILVGNVVDRLFIEGRQDLVDNTAAYNTMLRDKIPNWFRYESPIAYVDVNGNYDCRPGGCPDGYDGLHPGAMGEYHIAEAFAKVLKGSFGFAGLDFAVPASVPGRAISTPAHVQTLALPEGLFTTWDRIETARGYNIRSRIKGMTDWWSSGTVYPNTWGSWSTWLLDGQTWEFQVQCRGDHDEVSDWSALVSNTAKISTSPGPANIKSLPDGGDGIAISWDAVSGYDVSRYGVIVWDQDTPGAFLQQYAAGGTSYHVTGLKRGHRYGTWVTTYVNMQGSLTAKPVAAGGLPASGREVIVGSGAPAPPSGLTVANIDATTVKLSWSAAANSAGYSIYVNGVTDDKVSRLDGSTTSTSWETAFLFPGTWNYQFCVAAYNGHVESGRTCVVPPKCCGFEKRDDGPVSYPALATNTSAVYDSASMVEDAKLRALHTQLMQNQTDLGVSPVSG